MTELKAKEVKAELEARLFAYARKPIGVVVPTIIGNGSGRESPLPKAECNRTVAIFLDETAAARCVGSSGRQTR